MMNNPNTTSSFLERSLGTEGGYEALRAVREIYSGSVRRGSDLPALLLDVLDEFGIIKKDHTTLSLTSHGYIVGNICKEYCNWVDAGRTMPPPKPPADYYRDKAVLDLGCSFGRWLWEFEEAGALTGIEMETEYVEAAKALSARESKNEIRIINASVEKLGEFIEPGTIDFAFCRLVFNHVMVKSTLAQTYDALKTGGRLWLHVESYKVAMASMVRGGRLRSNLHALFALLNTVAFTVAGKQFSIRSKGRMHDMHKPVYPSSGTWCRVLRAAGFHEVVVRRLPRAYIIEASK